MTRLFELARPVLHALPAETAHGLTIFALRHGIGVPGERAPDDPILAGSVWNRAFLNPVGLAAGFDKGAEVVDQMLRFGFGFVEAGSITPRPQPGNPKPRLFRLTEDRAVINRMGFNSKGHAAALAQLARRDPSAGLLGVNLGANKDSGDMAADYAEGVRNFAPHADYLVANVSSPNTPGLRDLQRREVLADLISRVLEARDGAGPPVLIKIAPDLTSDERADIAAVALEAGIDGLVVSNTTVARPGSLVSAHKTEAGGLSGRPLMTPATDCLADIYRLTGGKLPLVGVGGVSSGADAYRKIRAGASLVQLYSALVFEGPALVARIKADLAALLRRDGFSRVSEAVGADHR